MRGSTDPIETVPADGPVLDSEGHFHAIDEPIDLSGYGWEDWLTFGFFWLLALDVFYQFFTRYVLADSAAWTEEIARYLLIGTVFMGAAIGVAKNNHIQVDLLYRYLPPGAARALALAVDVARVAFFAAMVGLTGQMMLKLGNYRMTIIDLPMNILYGVCLIGFATAALRSALVMRIHLKRGYSVLERPETTMDDRR